MIIVILLFLNLLQAQALRCYICNTQQPNTTDVRPDPCADVNSNVYENYDDCPPDSLCSKIIFPYREGVVIQKGCSDRASRAGYAHRIGCGRQLYPESQKTYIKSLYNTICFCDTDFCNGREVLMPSIATFVITLIFHGLLVR